MFGDVYARADRNAMLETIDPFEIDDKRTIDVDSSFLGLARRRNSPIKGQSYYQDVDFAAVFCGDLVGADEIAWTEIIDILKRRRFRDVPELPGLFALAGYDTRKRALYLMSDVYSFFPLYYAIDGGSAFFSTSLASFARFGTFEFNPAWLFEYMYFNFAISKTTLYKGIHRMPPASILQYDMEELRTVIHSYGKGFRRKEKLLEGRDALVRAKAVFNERMPLYYGGQHEIAHALSGGFDTRTVLAFMPPGRESSIMTYTYGMPGCSDITEARMLAEKLGLPHRELLFDDAYVKRLPELFCAAVFASGGLENTNRACLVHAFRAITEEGTRFPVILGGVAADIIFRGHTLSPHFFSLGMEKTFLSRKKTIDSEHFRRMFGARFDEFYAHINAALDDLQERFGAFEPVDSCFGYLLYEAIPRYFNGELVIANHFASYRIPFLDPEIVRLACEIEFSIFRLGKFIHTDTYREGILQSYLISQHPKLGRIPLHGLPLVAFTSQRKPLYQLLKLVFRGSRKALARIRRDPVVPIEDWGAWYRTVLKHDLENLLLKDPMIGSYVEADFLRETLSSNIIHPTKLFASAELTMRLASRGWKR